MTGKRLMTFLLTLLVLVLALVLASTALAAGGWVQFSNSMSGDREVPGPGDPDGSGWATFSMNIHKQTVCYTLAVENIDPATAAHIYLGKRTAPGPVVVPLEAPADGDSEACVTGVAKTLIRDMINHPNKYYVNVHNPAYPGGAVRGQLRVTN